MGGKANRHVLKIDNIKLDATVKEEIEASRAKNKLDDKAKILTLDDYIRNKKIELRVHIL